MAYLVDILSTLFEIMHTVSEFGDTTSLMCYLDLYRRLRASLYEQSILNEVEQGGRRQM